MCPMHRPMGRTTELHSRGDDVIHIVSLKTRNGEPKRTVSRIYILPINDLISDAPRSTTLPNVEHISLFSYGLQFVCCSR